MTRILHPTVPSKTTTLHVYHVFLYISLPSLHDDDVNFTFLEDVNTRQRFSFCFSELRYSPLEFNSWKIASIWQIKGAGIKAMKFETVRIHFWVTFLPPLPSSLLKIPVFILSLLQYYLTLNVPRLRAVSYFSLQSYCTRNLSTRAAKPRAAKNEGVSSTKSVFSRLVPIPRNLQSRWMR